MLAVGALMLELAEEMRHMSAAFMRTLPRHFTDFGENLRLENIMGTTITVSSQHLECYISSASTSSQIRVQ